MILFERRRSQPAKQMAFYAGIRTLENESLYRYTGIVVGVLQGSQYSSDAADGTMFILNGRPSKKQ